MKIYITILFMFFTTLVAAESIPSEWEFPNEKDLYPSPEVVTANCSGSSTERTQFCKVWEDTYIKHQNSFRKANDHLSIRGDYNGDGRLDDARLMINHSTGEVTIFVLFSPEEIYTVYKTSLTTQPRFLHEETFATIQATDFMAQCEAGDKRCRANQAMWGFDCDEELAWCQQEVTTLQKLPFDLIWVHSMGELLGDTSTNEVSLRPDKTQFVYYWAPDKKAFQQAMVGETITVAEKTR